jgi:hypothetical protein
MHYKLIESDKYDLRMQVCNVVEKANNLSRSLASESEYFDGYHIQAYESLTGEMVELEAMLHNIRSRKWRTP